VVSGSQPVRQSSPEARRAGVSSGQPARHDGAAVWSPPSGAPSNAGAAPRDEAGADSVDVYRGTAISQGLDFAVGAEADGQLVRWNAFNERQVLSFSDQARVVAIASHGRHFAVGSYSGLTKLYTADGLLEPVVLQESGAPVLALAFSARGNRVASLGADGVVTLYTFDLDTLLEKGRQIVGQRRLTDGECGQYSLDRVTCDGNRLTWSVVMRKILPLKER
jgi:WD40 repeat protein